jgi:hypothetical protein
MTDVIQLTEQLGCRNYDSQQELPLPLPQQWAVCLARGADAVLVAIHLAGGAMELTLADAAAASCLCYGLVQAVGDLRRRWLPAEVRERTEHFFAMMGPDKLQHATIDMQEGMPGCAQRTYAAARLAHAWVIWSTRPWRMEGTDRENVQLLAAITQVRRQVFMCMKNSGTAWLPHAAACSYWVRQCSGLEPLQTCMCSKHPGACCSSVLTGVTFVTQLSTTSEFACRASQRMALRCCLRLKANSQLGQPPSAEQPSIRHTAHSGMLRCGAHRPSSLKPAHGCCWQQAACCSSCGSHVSATQSMSGSCWTSWGRLVVRVRAAHKRFLLRSMLSSLPTQPICRLVCKQVCVPRPRMKLACGDLAWQVEDMHVAFAIEQ